MNIQIKVMRLQLQTQHKIVKLSVMYNEATKHVQMALEAAVQAEQMGKYDKDERAACLKRAADLMEARIQELMVLLCRESGKTYANAIAEVREAVDFLRYYATQIENLPANAQFSL
jgi:RHH-type proline utilization regulon transcriptional repressor/proline dehydrogenase/delta 1-pyrroline-5-carboxylate dehydrogenase